MYGSRVLGDAVVHVAEVVLIRRGEGRGVAADAEGLILNVPGLELPDRAAAPEEKCSDHDQDDEDDHPELPHHRSPF
jgi:hypothetical protein